MGLFNFHVVEFRRKRLLIFIREFKQCLLGLKINLKAIGNFRINYIRKIPLFLLNKISDIFAYKEYRENTLDNLRDKLNR